MRLRHFWLGISQLLSYGGEFLCLSEPEDITRLEGNTHQLTQLLLYIIAAVQMAFIVRRATRISVDNLSAAIMIRSF
jgi:hypothetical protein